MGTIVLEISLCLIENIIIYLFLNLLLRKRYNSILPLIISILINSIATYFCSSLYFFIKMPLTIVFLILGASVLYKDKTIIKFTYIIISLYIMCIVDIILGNLISLILSKDIAHIFFENFYYRLIFSLIIKILDVLIFILLYKMLFKIDKNIRNKFWTLISIVVFVFLAITTVFLQIYPNIEQDYTNTALYTILALLFFFMSLIIIYFFTELSKGFQRDSKLFLLENNFITLQEQIALQQQNNSNIKKIRHDMKNHLINVRTLIDNGEIADAVALLDKTAENVNHVHTEVINTGNSFVDAILLSKKALCRKKQIDLTYSVQHLETINISEIDLSSLFSNLIDNAIESAIQVPKPFIKLKIFKYNAYYTICIENSYKGKQYIKESSGVLISTKDDTALHGYGTQIISDIAQKYGGSYSWEAQNDKFVTTVIIKI